MLFQITYEGQLVCSDLELSEATQIAEELKEEAIADDCEPLYVVEQQMNQEPQL